jgi:protein TonB
VVLAALLSYAPARSALLGSAPIMVDWITAPRVEPRPEPPKRVKAIPKPVEIPPAILPKETPAQMSVPATPEPPPPLPAPVAAAPAPVALTPPVFNADYLDNPSPVYPALSRRLHEQGRVVLRVLVNTRGAADDVQINASSGHARLDDSARDTVRRWKFVPARRGAEAVPAWVLVPVSFGLEG